MSTQVTNYYQIVSQMPQDASVSFQDVSWSDYEELSPTEDESSYVRGPSSAALPILTATLLTESIDRMRSEGELSALLAFDQWLQTRQ